MGIQCVIEKDILENAGVKVEVVLETHYDYDEDGNEYPHDVELDVYHFNNGFIAVSYSPYSFCIDVNHWGENRGNLMEALKAHGLNYDEVAREV